MHLTKQCTQVPEHALHLTSASGTLVSLLLLYPQGPVNFGINVDGKLGFYPQGPVNFGINVDGKLGFLLCSNLRLVTLMTCATREIYFALIPNPTKIATLLLASVT